MLQETDNPDLRDRAYVYWRLLSSDPEAARSVVLAEKPVIAQDTSSMDPKLLQTLLGNLSTLSSVYHLPPSVRLHLARLYACLYPGSSWASLNFRKSLPSVLPSSRADTAVPDATLMRDGVQEL